MKRKSLLIMILGLCCMTATVSAQITTGAPSAKTIKLGNRATAGDYGLYLGLSSDVYNGIISPYIGMSSLPLINFKYMKSDNLEYRLGLEVWRKTGGLKGNEINETIGSTTAVFLKDLESRVYLYPGLAYHFSNTNILDVYVGAELPIGTTRSKIKEEEGDVSEIQSSLTFDVGLGAFIGLQAYIGNMPLSVGFEYGISSLFHYGDKVKYLIDDGQDTQEFYVKKTDSSYSGAKYDELHVSQGEIGNQIRFTITYYFKRGNNTKE